MNGKSNESNVDDEPDLLAKFYPHVDKTPKNPRAGSDLVSDVIAERVCDKPLTRPTDVVYNLKKYYGLEVSYRVTWLGVKKTHGEMFGAHSILFDQLRWYSNVVMDNNPGSYINIDYDEQNNHFIRYFISFKACIDGFNHCRPLLFLDGTFLKGKFKENLLAATAKDGSQGLFPLAIAIVDSENTTNWSWFLGYLANVVDGQRTLTFVSDRHTGLLESIPIIFPTTHHAPCLHHLQCNLQGKMQYVNSSYRYGLLAKFRLCIYALTVTTFNHSLEEFIKSGRKVTSTFFKDLPPEYWSNAFFHCHSLTLSTFFLHHVLAYSSSSSRYVFGLKLCGKWPNEGAKAEAWHGVVCPKMEARLVKAYNKGRSWLVSQSNDEVYEVHSFPSVIVDVERRFPCAHAVVAIRNSGKDLYELVDLYYHVTEYRSLYAYNIIPIPTIKKPPFNAEDFRPPGRPKKKWMLSRVEQVQQIRCSWCQRMGN
ncbi:hypothetical protein ACSBR1_036369 [Camellia fascicularis]